VTSYLNIPDNWAALTAGRDAKAAADEATRLTRAGRLADALEAASKGSRHLASMEALLNEAMGRPAEAPDPEG
jgi:hypothetical protein